MHLARAVAALGAWRAADSPERNDRASTSSGCADLVGREEAERYRGVLSPDRRQRAAGRRRSCAEQAAPRLDAAHVGVADDPHRRLPLQRHSVRGQGDDRRPHAARRGSGAVSRAGASRSSTIRRSTSRIDRARRAAGRHRRALDSDAFKAIEAAVTQALSDAVTLPMMSTGATDMAFVRAKGMQCYGIGPAVDVEDGAKGFGAHSDQERILESELHRFVRFQWDIVSTWRRQNRIGNPGSLEVSIDQDSSYGCRSADGFRQRRVGPKPPASASVTISGKALSVGYCGAIGSRTQDFRARRPPVNGSDVSGVASGATIRRPLFMPTPIWTSAAFMCRRATIPCTCRCRIPKRGS